MNAPLWTPSSERINHSNFTRFAAYLNEKFDLNFANYAELHKWSVNESAAFWQSIVEFTQVKFKNPASAILENKDKFPDAIWFKNSTLNFAENLLARNDNKIALVSYLENGERKQFSYAELNDQVFRFAHFLTQTGVKKGDRVAGYMPNIAETIIAMLATTSIGAVWSSCSPDFGINGVVDRFGQIEPKVLVTANGYHYNGKVLSIIDKVDAVAAQIKSLEKLVIVPVLAEDKIRSTSALQVKWQDCLNTRAETYFEPVEFNHPLFIMFSSGTTGKPKCIVHGTGGTLLQHRKEHVLHVDLTENDVFFYYTTCGWMMWNWLVSGIASGATLVLFDGSPSYPNATNLVDLIDKEKISIFGTSAKFIAALEKSGATPITTHSLKSLETILSTGSPLLHENFRYIYNKFKKDVCLSSISGGTDIISCFVLGNPTLPVYEGEIQCASLGMDVAIFDELGSPIKQEKGELVCRKPFPSCPIGFWNDPNGEKFHSAYFSRFSNIWAHGDYGEITEHGGFVIHGRSDAVLNPGGVRIGTAEIYRQVEKIDQILECVAVGQNWQGDERIILFVRLKPGFELSSETIELIKRTIRENTTPRHVPSKIIAVSDIPRTISGKIVELAVRKVIHNEEVTNTDALANPEALALFKNLSELAN